MSLHGVVVIDKPAGPTSHDIVAKAKRVLATKVGHAGTLDPFATGVLPLLVGHATRLSRFLLHADKEYLAVVRFGRRTDTFDREGKVLDEKPVPEITDSVAQDILNRFTGSIEQVPPPFSAVKVAGKRLYELARKQLAAEAPARLIEIHSMALDERAPDLWTLRVHCSSGTYIRRLADDLGQAVGCGAYLESLIRTRAGVFRLDQAVKIEELGALAETKIVPLEHLLPQLPRLDLDHEQAQDVRHGRQVAGRAVAPGDCRLFFAGRLIGIGRVVQGSVQPETVFVDQIGNTEKTESTEKTD